MKSTCKKCGVNRVSRKKDKDNLTYIRNGRVFETGVVPECVDWEKEDSKTID